MGYPNDVRATIFKVLEGGLMLRILVVGGAGYIGSHMMKALTKASREFL